MKNLVAGVVLGAAMFTAGAVFTASKSDDDVLREARDRQQIDELMWRYARALDTGDADGYAALYTTDGQFSSGANATKGRDALKKMIAGARQPQPGAQPAAPRPPMYHTTANHQIVFTDKDHARIDELERVNGQWLIKSRNVAPMD